MSKSKLKNYIELPLAKLVKAPWNYKGEDEEKSKKLQSNLKRNGQIQNLIVRELETGFYEVVNGNHRLDDMTFLEMETAVCYNCGNISLAQAQRIAIETNETNFDTDTVKLAGLLKEINESFTSEELLETLPYSNDQFEALINLNQFDWNNFNGSRPEESEEDLGNDEKNSAVIKLKVKAEEVDFIKGQLKNFFLGRYDIQIVE